MATEIVLPKIFQEIAFTSIAEQTPSIVINNLPDKIFAVPSYGQEISLSRAAELYSHTHVLNSEGAPASKKWDTVRWYPGMSAEQLANSIPSDPGYLVMAEIAENQYNNGASNPFPFIDEFFQRCFAKTGMADPTDTNLISDYFDHDGIGQVGLAVLQATPGSAFFNTWRSRFSSESEARKTRDGGLSNYFARGAFNNRNWMMPGYLDGWHRVPEHIWPYIHIAELEQKHLAVRRKVVQFSADILEGAEWKIYRAGSFQSIRFENPAGLIFKSTLNAPPPEMMYRQAIIGSTIGDGMIHWNTASRTSRDIARWTRSHNGGSEPYKTQWLKDGANSAVIYNWNDPTQPAKSPGDAPDGQTGNNLKIVPPTFHGPTPYVIHDALAGRYMASITRSKQGTLKYPVFRWRVNGGAWQNGYNGTNNPVNGSLGNSSVSTLNNRNFGQNNIVTMAEYKKPICWVGGSAGNGVVHFCYPLARINDVVEAEITDGDTFTVQNIGPAWRVFNR